MAILACALLGTLLGVITLPKWRRDLVPFGYSDSLVQMMVLDQPHRFAGSLVLPQAQATEACADWPWRLLLAMCRLNPVQVDALRYLLTLALAASATGALAAACGGSTLAALLATALLLGSRFAELGWWFRPAFTFFTTHGLVALAWGSLLFGLALSGHGAAWLFALAGLLVSYHPVHGLVVTGLLVLLALAGVMDVGDAASTAHLALLWCAGVLPLAVLLVRQRRTRRAIAPAPAADVRLWWQLMQSRTRNIFATAALDARSGGGGLRTCTTPPVLSAAVGLIALWGLALVAAPRPARVGAAILWLSGLAGFIAQWLVADRLRIPVLARLALARAGTYMTFASCVAWALLAFGVIQNGSLPGACAAALSLVAVTWVPKADNSWIIALSLLPLLAGHMPETLPRLLLSLPPLLLGVLVASPMLAVRLPRRPLAAPLVRLRDRILPALRLAPGEKLPLVALALAACVTLLPAPPVTPVAPAAVLIQLLFTALAVLLACRFALAFRSPLAVSPAAWEDVQRWAQDATPPGSLFVAPPYLSGFEVFSARPQFMNGFDIQMALYVPALVKDITARCAAYGVDLATVAPMGLMPRLVAAHRQLTPEAFDRMGAQFGVRYGIFERRQWQRAAWPARPILFENPEFVVVAPVVDQSPLASQDASVQCAPGGPFPGVPSPRSAGRGQGEGRST